MSNESNERALAVYKSICDALDGMEINYNKHAEDLVIVFGHRGEDMNHNLIFQVEPEKEVIRLVEILPIKMNAAKAGEIAKAVCVVNNNLLLGNFNYNLEERLTYEVTQVYSGSLIGGALIERMVMALAVTVERYDDKFLALNKGYIGVDTFKG